MNKEIIESKNAYKNETLATMVKRKFGIEWKSFKENNMARLASIAGVSEEEYRNSKGKKNIEYNTKIRTAILQNKLPPMQKYSDVIRKFSPEQQKKIEERFPAGKINTYMTSLKDETIQKIKQLPPGQLVVFLEGEIVNIQTRTENIQSIHNGNPVNQGTTEQIVAFDELIGVNDRIDRLINNQEEFRELRRDIATLRFDNEREKECVEYEKIFKLEHKNTYDVYKNKLGGKGVEELIRRSYVIKKLQSKEFQSKMNNNIKTEFNALVIEYYEINQKFGIDLAELGLQSIYENAKQYFVEKYTTNESYTPLFNNIHNDPDVTAYFDTHKKTTELVDTSMKNTSYYTKLLTWYPDLDTQYQGKKISEYLPYFNDDMTIKDGTPEKQKKVMSAILINLKEQGKTYEKKLLHRTNTNMQNAAIQQCITTLQKYMDVNISEKDNIAQQMEINENKDAVSPDMVFHINGTLNGKRVSISYNLTTGVVAYKSFLTKKNDNDQGPLLWGSENEEDQVPLITLPKFGDFVDVTDKNTDYYTLINTSETLDEYDKKFTQKLQESVQKSMGNDMDIEKDMLKKFIIKDMIVQDICAISGKENATKNLSDGLISKEQYPQMHGFYSYLYRSLEYYSYRSLDQLQLFQKNMTTLLQYKDDKGTQSTESVTQYKNTNKEMFVIQALVNQTTIPLISSFGEQGPEANLLSFFKCFEQEVGSLSIIDVQKMNDYFTAAQGTNKENNEVGKWKKNQSFTTLINNLDTKVSGDQATKELDMKLNA